MNPPRMNPPRMNPPRMNPPRMNPPRNPLERRYRRLLRIYPAGYRTERGEEIVGTYLDAAGPDQLWPSVADVSDVLTGSLRQRLRTGGAVGLTAAVPVAATFALTAAATLAAVWLLWIEIRPAPHWFVVVPFGPFQSLGALVWIGWLVAGLATVAVPARVARLLVLAALLVTVAVVPAAALLPFDRPPLFVLVPQVALGVVALGWPTGRRWPTRLTAPLAVAATGVAAALTGPTTWSTYRRGAAEVLAATAAVVLLGSLVTACVAAFRGDSRRLWAVLILLTPATLLVVRPFARTMTDVAGLPDAEWSALAGVAAGVSVVTTAGLALATVLRARYLRRQPRPCPTCGHRRV